MSNNTKSTITIKNINRPSEGVLSSSYGDIPVAVKKTGSLYYCIVDGRNTGLNKLDAKSSWEELCTYLNCVVVEDPNLGKKVKKAKRARKTK